MKKRFLTVLFALTAAVAVIFTTGNVTAYAVNDSGQYIFDGAELLTTEEFDSLNDYARQISEYYKCGVHIITTTDPNVNEYTIQQYAENTYLKYIDFGWGQDKDGFMLVLGMNDRSWWLLAYGPKGNYALTDYGKEEMSAQFLDDFRNNDWYGGFSDYLSFANYALDEAENGHPVDIYYSSQTADVGIEAYGIAAVIGILSAAVTCSFYKKQMQTAVTATRAEDYVETDEVDMQIRRDTFKFVNRTRTRVAQQSSSGGGSRGGTTINSRGFSGRGGKF